MIRMRLLILSCVCSIAAGCGFGVDVGAERDALLNADRAWSAAASVGDMDRVLPYWTEDAVIIAAGVPEVRGKEAIRAFSARNRSRPGFSIGWQPLEAVVSQDATLGYTRGDYRITFNGPDGLPMEKAGRYLSTWQKDATGAWRCTLEIHSPLDAAGGTDLRPDQNAG